MEDKENIENVLENILGAEWCNISAEDLSESERNIISRLNLRYSKSLDGFVKVVPLKEMTALVQIKVRDGGNMYCMILCKYRGRLVNFKKEWIENFRTKNADDFVERLVKYRVL